ncbi:OLC1v1034179C1 [Oldenlandia corymbosa var. corymbosa]|uniref:OLC1v1034179C1 n=1 Tax=Oldenlandia corymbosa var. corymbosa TaxID=529605 RepID=A0AAV1CT54_OLDCO|nr:OLC1v1034179C1 [Oldenlandia corymbosa var. corymbosa]
MWGKKMGLVKKLSRKSSKSMGTPTKKEPSPTQYLLGECLDAQELSSPRTTPTGKFPVYVGEDRQRFVVPTGYLGHPLFKMLLEKASDQYGFNHQSGLVVPCSVATFEEVILAVEAGRHGKFDFGDLVEEFL